MPKVVFCYLHSRGEGGDKVPRSLLDTRLSLHNNTITHIYQYQEKNE